MKYILYLIALLIVKINCLHLTYKQVQTINDLIRNNKLTKNQRDVINRVLYNSYEKFAVKKAIEFKKIHKFKCKNINTNDLVLSSKIGLYNAIKNYNGKYYFNNYTQIYIKGQLLKTLTNHFSLTTIPKNIRVKNKNNFTKRELQLYKKKLDIKFLDYSNNWQFDINYNKNKLENSILDNINRENLYKELWIKVNNLDPFLKKIIHLKFDFYFNKKRSNKHISELLCCSEETIRKNLIHTIKNKLL